MFRLDANRPVEFCDGLRRRDFLHAGSLTALRLSLGDMFGLESAGAVPEKKDVNCIFLMLVGGPSQLDTWDMKPNAPLEIRGPYKPIKTNVPGIEISENFPRMARHADKYTLIRSLYHTAAAVHDTGHQMMQTGHLFEDGIEHPHIGCVLTKVKGSKCDLPAHVLVPRPIGHTGGNLSHGQGAGHLGKRYDPFIRPDMFESNSYNPDILPPDYLAAVRADDHRYLQQTIDDSVRTFEASRDYRLFDSDFHNPYTVMTSSRAREAFQFNKEPQDVQRQYGFNRFGRSCLLARRLIEAGVRFVTVNMFETVFDEITWDIHGSRPFSPMSCYRDTVGPMFDMAYSSLLEDLSQRGLLTTTMVVATGEFGRTPMINPAGGRDHWPQCWTVLMSGGPIRGGQVIGSSDEIAGSPKDRPVTPAEIAATVYEGLGIDLKTEWTSPTGRPLPLIGSGVKPIRELF